MRDDGSKSVSHASVASSKRMLRIKGLRNALNEVPKDRFNEDANIETKSIRDSIVHKKRTLSYALRNSQDGGFPELS